VAAIAFTWGPSLVLAHSSQRSQPEHVALVSENEPGEHLIVRGVVYAPDGVTPVAGIQLTIHNADSKGYYCMLPSPERDRTLPRDNCPDSPVNTARIRGSLTTDAQGRYEFHTVRPGPYPNRRDAAHIHIHASGQGYPEQSPPALLFAGDPFINKNDAAANAKLGKFRFICEPQREGKALVCVYDIRLERK
jgi:protocatechuate 3,4-dioxygenase beta subunit